MKELAETYCDHCMCREWASCGLIESARVFASANYAAAQNFGSGLYGPEAAKYAIKPNAKKALAFSTQGIINERFGVQKTSSAPVGQPSLPSLVATGEGPGMGASS